jgi:ribonuclease BN (tRNA processing enzyme)
VGTDDSLFISHFHVDHAGELAALFLAFRHGMKTERSEPLTIVGPRGLDRVMEGLKLAFGSNLFDTKFPISVRLIGPGEQIELGPDSILSVMKTPHTPESLAVRIESGGRVLCYTGDTAYDDGLARFFEGANVLISECSFREPLEGVPHLSVSEAARLASEARVSKLIVSHFYFNVDEAELKSELERGYDGEVIIGSDGFSIDV